MRFIPHRFAPDIALCFAKKKKQSRKGKKKKFKVYPDKSQLLKQQRLPFKKRRRIDPSLDFKDGLEYYAAIENSSPNIITEGRDDLYFCGFEGLASEAFFEKYMMKKKK